MNSHIFPDSSSISAPSSNRRAHQIISCIPFSPQFHPQHSSTGITKLQSHSRRIISISCLSSSHDGAFAFFAIQALQDCKSPRIKLVRTIPSAKLLPRTLILCDLLSPPFVHKYNLASRTTDDALQPTNSESKNLQGNEPSSRRSISSNLIFYISHYDHSFQI